MSTVKGTIIFNVGDESYTLSNVDTIHLCDEDGLIDKIITEDAVDNFIKMEKKRRKSQGCLYDIKLYLADGTMIASADNFRESYGNLKFNKDQIL